MALAACLICLACLILAGLTTGLALFFSPAPDLWGGADFSRVFTDREGRLLRVTLTEDQKYRIFTPLEHLPAQMREATLLYEDRAFWSHGGVNILAMGRALWGMLRGGRRMGASTVTMQLARLTGDRDSASLPGKVRQIWRALVLERHYSKRDILEAYLNLAPYGANVEGVGAAARVWYGKEAGALNLPEILGLVPVPQHPAARNPQALQGKALPGARLRLNALWGERHPEDANDLFARAPLRVYGPEALPFEAPHAVNGLLRDMREASQHAPAPTHVPHAPHGPGKPPDAIQTPEAPEAPEASDTPPIMDNSALQSGRFDSLIRTTLDLPRQHLLERCLQRAVARNRAWGMDNAAALLLDWRDMEIRALAGSADFHQNAIQGQVDGTLARRSPGSTLKPFIYALALQQGLIHPQTILADTPRVFRGYAPENADGGFQGPISAQRALQASRNIPAISLAGQLKQPTLYDFLHGAGVDFQRPAEHYGLALVLGGAEVSMRELAGLYAMLPNRGLWRPLRLIRAEDYALPMAAAAPGSDSGPTDPDGRPDGRPDEVRTQGNGGPSARACLMPEAAYVTLDMLRMPSPQGFDRTLSYWKTGTSNGQRDAWTVGLFGPYVLAVWVGRFDGAMNPGFSGLHAAAPLFFDIVQALGGMEALPDLPRQSREGLGLRRVRVCASTGDVNTALCTRSTNAATVETWFIPGTSPIKDSGILREILVDRESGLRQCRDIPGRSERLVWEFWPGDLRRLFAEAGIAKPAPPPYAPECLEGGTLPGKKPEILSPRPGISYALSLSRPEPIPLLAASEEDETLFWFAGDVFLGSAARDQELLWMPRPGLTDLRVIDGRGRSAALRVNVELLP